MTTKLTDRERRRRELSSAPPPADVLADVIFSAILSREAELVALTGAGLRCKKSWPLFERCFD
jgi:hypothetical protein